MKFTKMHGIGNDFIILDAIKTEVKKPEKLALEICRRNFGIGADGLILILRSDKSDFRMRIFNSDGSEAEMCGNGIRCFAKYVFDHGLTKKKDIAVETLAGVKQLRLFNQRNRVAKVRVDLGEPILQRERIPMIGDPGMVINESLLLERVRFSITALSVGNPHVVVYVEDIRHFPVEKYGPMIENHNLFPNRTNVEFIEVVNDGEIIQRTWERGAGETMACGTGAAAATVAGVLTGKTSRRITVRLSGGELLNEWSEEDNHVYLTGPAVEVYEGVWKH